MEYAKSIVLLATTLGAAIVVIAAAIGIGKLGSTSVESIARQPEAGKQIRGAMLITAALIEGIALFALVLCFLIQNKISF